MDIAHIEIKREAEQEYLFIAEFGDIENFEKESDEILHTDYNDLITKSPQLCSFCCKILESSYAQLQHNITHMRIHIPRVCEAQDDCIFICKTEIEDGEKQYEEQHEPLTNYPLDITENNNTIANTSEDITIANNSESNSITNTFEDSTLTNNSEDNTKKVKKKKKCICGKSDCKEKSLHKVKLTLCDLCEKPFSKLYLYLHKRLMHGDKELKCEFCNRVVQTQANLIRHKQVVHGKKIKKR
ncbi:unnamed protein product [Colias eurytheme]|nr:unnamed protein product [Colias eurytheme]